MKILFLFTLTGFSLATFAQDTPDLNVENLYNRWSVEINAGQNKAIKPFAAGYYSSDPSKNIFLSGVKHFDFGIRYMFSNTFGLKFDYALDKFNEQSGTSSLPFDTKQNRLGLQGIINLGRLLQFDTFTKRFGILAHAGVHVSQFSVHEGSNKNISEYDGGVLFGLTPQIYLSKWLALTVDLTVQNNMSQHLNWDGSTANPKENLSGVLYNTSLGFTAYLGKKEKHADWYVIQPPEPKSDVEGRKRLDAIETQLNDTDRDGVVDYLDVENNTPTGVTVDTKGRFIDTNKNGIPDELETNNEKVTTTQAFANVASAEKEFVENGLVNIYFDVNQDTPNSGSTNNINIILHYLTKYPDAKAKLFGFADKRGDEKLNQELSQRRAKNVYELLVASGIDASRITIEGQGVDTTITADNKTSFELARRVSIQVEK